MKNSKILLISLLTLLVVCLLAACTAGTPGAETAPSTEGQTQAETLPPVTKVDVSLSVLDQDGQKVTEATLTILPTMEGGESATLSLDAEGKATVSLPEGEYTVRFDLLPEYVLGPDTPLVVTAGMEPVVLSVTDNTPNGSEERPFVINEDSVTVSVPAGATYHFTLFGGNNRTLTLEHADAEITYKDAVHTPDESGRIEVRMSTDTPRDPSFFALTNKGDAAAEFSIRILSDPGTMDNPIEIPALGELITAQVPTDGMVYYQWIATEAGVLTVTSPNEINNISLNNLSTSQVSNFTEGNTTETLEVSVGDVITVVVAVIGGNKTEEYNTVTFTLTVGE